MRVTSTRLLVLNDTDPDESTNLGWYKAFHLALFTFGLISGHKKAHMSMVVLLCCYALSLRH